MPTPLGSDFVVWIGTSRALQSPTLQARPIAPRVARPPEERAVNTTHTTLTKEVKEDFVVFGASFFVHATLLLCLAACFIREDRDKVTLTILSSPVEEYAPDQTVSILDVFNFSETETLIASADAAEPEPVFIETLLPRQEVTVSDLELSSPPIDVFHDLDVEAEELYEIVSIPPTTMAGTAGEGVASIGGAVDRLTAEIARSAAGKETLVVWLFDASLSLSSQREQIADRLSKILDEIESDGGLRPVTHVVCSFGERLNVLIPEPVNDRQTLVKSIRQIGLDESGVENIFASVERLATDYESTTRRRTMIIAFTDEVGDDQQKCDSTLEIAQRKGVAVYVVGTPAPFGITQTQLKFVDPDDRFDQTERWVEIDQGPESLFKMTLNISSLPIDGEPMDSGFGPYALSRLCAFTGGIYFALHPNRHVGSRVRVGQIQTMASRIQHFFDGQVMRKYSPDYRAAALQRRDVDANAAKTALLKACTADPVDVRRQFKTVFEAPNQGAFVSELAEGQTTAASLLTKIDPLYATLRQGEAAAKALKEPRWRASFFLAMGRALAIKTRLDAYNAILADAKMGLLAKNKSTNRWILEPSDSLALLNSAVAKQAETARGYLMAVVENFPGTPWALMAQRELETPLSYVWIEGRRETVAGDTAARAVTVGPLRAPRDDEKIELPRPKPRRNFDKI